MSRRCPKSNHLFLNWLKNNRSQFLIEPRVTKIYKRTMSGYFAGVTSAIKFFVYRGNHIDVDVFWNGQTLQGDCLAMFLSWEKRWKGGYFSEWLDPELNNFYATREELWLTECFEPFLDWCNKRLASHRWVAIYGDEIGGILRVRLQDSEIQIGNMQLLNLIKVEGQVLHNLASMDEIRQSKLGEDKSWDV